MYLKDCIVLWNAGNESHQHFRRFVLKEPDWVMTFDSSGNMLEHLFTDWPNTVRIFHGTPISDRDYRLAIARAKSQQALLTSKS